MDGFVTALHTDVLVVLRNMAGHGLDAALVEAFAVSVAAVDLLPALGTEIAPTKPQGSGGESEFKRVIMVTSPSARGAHFDR